MRESRRTDTATDSDRAGGAIVLVSTRLRRPRLSENRSRPGGDGPDPDATSLLEGLEYDPVRFSTGDTFVGGRVGFRYGGQTEERDEAGGPSTGRSAIRFSPEERSSKRRVRSPEGHEEPFDHVIQNVAEMETTDSECPSIGSKYLADYTFRSQHAEFDRSEIRRTGGHVGW